MAKQLIFVSGLGDNTSEPFYKRIVGAWAKSEFEPHHYIFGWGDTTTTFDEKFHAFLQYLRQFPARDEIYLVGISAGGSAVVNALSVRPSIKKVVTVSAAFQVRTNHRNAALTDSITRAQLVFDRFNASAKAKILNIAGCHDGTVPVAHSLLPGVHHARVLGFGHVMNILLATVVTKRQLRRFLLQP